MTWRSRCRLTSLHVPSTTSTNSPATASVYGPWCRPPARIQASRNGYPPSLWAGLTVRFDMAS